MPDSTAVCPRCRAPQPLRAQDRTLQPGTTIDRGYGRIVVDACIGSGTMGTVYRAWLFWDPQGPRRHDRPAPLALKQLKPQASLQPEIRAFFLNEAEALQRLSHPNVVGFHELFAWSPERPTLAMEYVDGSTLEDVIARNVARSQLAGPSGLPGLPFQRAWYYLQQLLGGLAAAHSLGIVHRDVKPSNIMIRRDGIVKLTDFGIAHLVNPTHGQRVPSPEELAPGTGAYMAPEQVVGMPLDGRSDLYSAAIVLYEALAGRTPFLSSEKTEFLIRMDQVETAPPPIRSFLPQAPPILDQLFSRALAKDPSARFSSAIEMGDAFRSAFGLPSTPEWRALGEIAQVAREAHGDPERMQRLATIRQVVQHAFTAKMENRPSRA